MEPRNAVAGKEVNRPRPKVKRGPQWSRDPFDKMIAAMTRWRAWYRNDPEYIGAADYYDAMLKWHSACRRTMWSSAAPSTRSM
jgi:hypothetical protein